MGLYCELEDLHTESDVEQKFIYQFLSTKSPMGLGLDTKEILTKIDLRKVIIGKGKTQKIYYPDYVISIRGVPVLVVEAKKPNEDLNNAYSEARLYATEINAKFIHDLNVCKIIVVSNGTETWAGYFDTDSPEIKIGFEDFNVENVKFYELMEFCSRRRLQENADQPYKKSRGKAFFITPVSRLGGRQVQNEELEQNTFGRTLVFENSKVFDPETEEERYVIVDNAYISSAKREQHAEPIYKQIRKFEFPSKKNSIVLPTDNPVGLVEKIHTRIDEKQDAYSLMLIIGNVGSGKTTFVRWFKRKYLENKFPELASRCEWLFMDMNFAPNAQGELYSWIKEELLGSIKEKHQSISFTNIETLNHVFRKEIAEFKDGIGQLLEGNDDLYKKELYNLLKEKTSDSSTMLTAILDYLRGDLGIVPIVVLDNCDKRDRDTQLLMFEVAQWLRSKFKCIVLLPMRDTTYDLYKDEKPLDTIVKDLVFRIDPPDLLKVLQARLEYISRSISQNKKDYKLQNGMIVQIGGGELVEYYKSIMIAIRNSKMIKNIFYRLSDKNTRKGIEMFEDFCKSGHITADDIFQIRALDGYCDIPNHKFLNAVLRKNRRYYNGDESNFINLFQSEHNDDFPDPFIRIDILSWLKNNYHSNLHDGMEVSLRYLDLVHEMEIIGHDKKIIHREINYLISKGLIYTETQLNAADNNDLIMITIPGKLHLKMLGSVPYLAACSENVNYKNSEIANTISKRLMANNYLSKLSMALNAMDLLTYLRSYRNEYCARPEIYVAEGKFGSIFDLGICESAISKWIDDDNSISESINMLKMYGLGKEVVSKVIYKNKGGINCLLDGNDGYRGFLSIHDRKYKLSPIQYNKIGIYDVIICKILSFDLDHNSFQLEYIGRKLS